MTFGKIMLKRPKWMIFYDDGTVFTSDNGQPYNAPPSGALILIQEDADGKWVIYQKDAAYVWGWRSKDEWVPVDQIGIIDYLLNHRDVKAILFGRWTSNENFDEIWEKANIVWRQMANGQ